MCLSTTIVSAVRPLLQGGVPALLALAALPLPLNAALTIVSDFDTTNDLDGWQHYAGGDSGTTFTWNSHGEGLGGYANLDEGAAGFKDYFQAPAKFVSHLSIAFMSGVFNFSLRMMPDNPRANPTSWLDDIVLIGANGMVLFYSFGVAPVVGDWRYYDVVMEGIDPNAPSALNNANGAGWYYRSDGNPANSATWGIERGSSLVVHRVTNEQMAAVLADVEALYIKADHYAGAENVHLDNVRLTAVPEPMTTAALLAVVALAGSGVLRGRAARGGRNATGA